MATIVPDNIDDSHSFYFGNIFFRAESALRLCCAVFLVSAFLCNSGLVSAQDKDTGFVESESALFRGSEIRMIKQEALIADLRMSVVLKDEQIARLNARIAALDTIVDQSKHNKSQAQNDVPLERCQEYSTLDGNAFDKEYVSFVLDEVMPQLESRKITGETLLPYLARIDSYSQKIASVEKDLIEKSSEISRLSGENSHCVVALKSRTELLENLQNDFLSTKTELEDRNSELDKVTFELQKINNVNGILNEENRNSLISLDVLSAKVARLESDSRHFIAERRKVSGLLEKYGLSRDGLEVSLANLNSREMPVEDPVADIDTLNLETHNMHVGGGWFVRYDNTGLVGHLSLEEVSDMNFSLPDLSDCSLFVEGFESNPTLSDVLVVNGFRVNKIWVRIDHNRLGMCTVLRSDSGKYRVRFSKQKPSRVDRALVLMKKN